MEHDLTPTFFRSPDGHEMAVYDLGGRGDPALLCHCNGFHGPAYAPLASRMTGLFHVYAVDFRGHGASRGPMTTWEDPTYLTMADDLQGLIDARGWRGRVCVFGHSLGGAVVLSAEALRPGTFRAVFVYEAVLLTPAQKGASGLRPPSLAGAPQSEVGEARGATNGGEKLAAFARSRLDAFASVEDARAELGSTKPFSHLDRRCLDAFIRYGLATREDPAFKAIFPDVGPAVEARRQTGQDTPPKPLAASTPPGERRVVWVRCPREVEARIYELAPGQERYQLFERLPAIKCPVAAARGRLTSGAHGALAEAAAWIVDQVSGPSRLFRFDDLFHMGPLESPDRVGDTVARWFAQWAPGAEAGAPTRSRM
ncbi:unnamed protein product [Pedinophyceae sp. YPF-701]|nr:unnamed protein product [Pedinophyceae sp. YPF-701]